MKTGYKIFFISLFILILNLNPYLHSQTLNDIKAQSFIQALINQSEELENFVDKDELLELKKLGINYKNLKHKFLIGKDIPDAFRIKLKSGEAKYNYIITNLDVQYSLLELSSTDKSLSIKYYFLNGYLISAEKYFSRNWKTIESKYFIFHCSDENLTNAYAVNLLDKKIISLANSLSITNEELVGVKIHYFLCKDDKEIEEITGYKSRGMCNLAYDYIISTYNNHYHELIHLLINYKLKDVPLYVHPLLQEGVAVLYGGRGGLSSSTLLEAGLYMLENKFVSIDDYFSRNFFVKEDPSLTYPIAGIYNLFLTTELKFNDYLKLYRDYSFENPTDEKDKVFVQPASSTRWDNFLIRYINYFNIDFYFKLDAEFNSENIIFNENNLKISKNSNYYYILTNTDFLIKDTNKVTNYVSNKFKELCPELNYNGEHYYVKIRNDEISIYDLFTNNLIEQYSSGFDKNQRQLKIINGKFSFAIYDLVFVNHIDIEQGVTISQIIPIKK